MTELNDSEQRSRQQWVQGELLLAGMFDERLLRLFAAIERTGSINQAAKRVGLSYKGAWQMVERANNLAPKVLVNTATGGTKGGGTFLTPAGQSFLRLFRMLEEKHRAFLDNLNRELAADPDILRLLRRLIVKAGARNQFYGTITGIRRGGLDIEVDISLKGGECLVATIPEESAAILGLAVGCDTVVLIKSSEILLVTDFDGYRLSARNQLHGTVSRLQKGAVNSEVIITLPGGDSIAATVTNTSAESLQLQTGMEATAVFKSNAAILGTFAQ
jgi:molybdate transport system regulatory protein